MSDHPAIRLRSFRDADLPAVLALHARAYRVLAASHYTAAQIQALADLTASEDFGAGMRDNTVFVAETPDHRIVGSAGWSTSAQRPDAARLRLVSVDPDVAGNGVGRRLIETVEASAARAGFFRFRVRASLNAEAFYRALGYDAVSPGLMKVGDAEPLSVITMEKPA